MPLKFSLGTEKQASAAASQGQLLVSYLVEGQILRLEVSVVVADGVVQAREEEPGEVEAQVEDDDDLAPAEVFKSVINVINSNVSVRA